MKQFKALIFLFLLTNTLSSFGQDYIKTLGTVNEWYDWRYAEFGISVTFLFKTTKDTVIDSHIYKIIEINTTSGSNSINIYGLIREDTVSRKLFLRPCRFDGVSELCDTIDLLIYDYSKIKGDTVEVISLFSREPRSLIVDSIITDTSISMNRIHILHAISPPNYWQVEWIEGIGSLAGFSHNDESSGYGVLALICSFRDNIQTFSNSKFKYNYHIEDADSCVINTVSIEEEELTTLKVFPNPTNGQLHVLYVDPYKQHFKIINIYLSDINGKVVLQTQETNFSISDIEKGMYFMHIQLENKVFVQKIIIN